MPDTTTPFVQTAEQALFQWTQMRGMSDYTLRSFVQLLAGESIMPYGQCAGCDGKWERVDTFGPSHAPKAWCTSYAGGRPHCSCDSCF